MSYADDFNNELHFIESRFTGGLSNTSTKLNKNAISKTTIIMEKDFPIFPIAS